MLREEEIINRLNQELINILHIQVDQIQLQVRENAQIKSGLQQAFFREKVPHFDRLSVDFCGLFCINSTFERS